MKHIVLLSLLVFVISAAQVSAESAKAYNIRMHRTDMPDTTDIQSVLASIIKPGMTDEEKAKAIWRAVFQFSHQDNPPQEQIAGCTHDVMKLFNVYGYRMCCCAAGCVEALGLAAGFEKARTHGITNHNVSELWWGNNWHMMDSSLICYYKKDDGTIASVEEINQDAANLINARHCPTVGDGGWYPAATHNIKDGMTEYSKIYGEAADGMSNGWSTGYRCLLTLREGETLVRSCANTGQQQVNQDLGDKPGAVSITAGNGGGAYLNKQIPDQNGTFYYMHPSYHGGIVGNGTLTYEPKLAEGAYKRGVESEDNIVCTRNDGKSPALHLAKAGTGTVIIKMQCPYIFLDGTVNAVFTRATDAQQVKVYISTNNMLDWKQIYAADKTGTVNADISTKDSVYRRYSYYLKFELSSTGAPTDVGIQSLKISNLFQHAQRAMPFLVKGVNEFEIDAGKPISTITVNPRVTSAEASPNFNKNETLTTMHAIISKMKVTDGGVWDDYKGGGTLTFPVTAPGDIVAIRFGGTFRMRDARDSVKLQVSTSEADGGYVTVQEVTGPIVKKCTYVTYDKVPPGSKQAWVRYATTVRNTCGISGHVRVDVDYEEPNAKQLPFKIKHEWTENGIGKEHVETVTKWPYKYKIECANEPTMTALTVWVDAEDTSAKTTGTKTKLNENKPVAEKAPSATNDTAKSAQEDDPKDKIFIFVTGRGKMYHQEGCTVLTNAAIKVSLKEALKQGYTPCTKCNPPQ